MSLLPPQFQTPLTHALGEKITTITPAPKPHVHQWVPVPDSKVHCRCADCGAVTLTEAVNTVPPTAVVPAAPHWAPVPGMPGMRKAVHGPFNDWLYVNKHKVIKETSFQPTKEQIRTYYTRSALGKVTPQEREQMEGWWAKIRPGAPVTPKDEWRPNYGTQPVGDNILVKVRSNGVDFPAMRASEFNWGYPLLTHWKPA